MSDLTPAMDPMQEACQAASSCVKCGTCMSVCPVYKAGRQEELAARGKLLLVRGLESGQLGYDRHLLETLGRCLLCGRCSEGCPSMVPAMEAIRASRQVLAQKTGLPMIKRLLLEKGLTQPSRLDGLARTGRLGQPLAGLGQPAASGLSLRLPGLQGVEKLPRVASRFFLQDVPREIPGPKNSPRLGLFLGCVTNYMRPELGRRMLDLLSKRFTLVIPPEQGCCGLPALSAGLADSAASLARRNLRAFAGANLDRVVTACGSCAYTLAREAPHLLTGIEYEQALALANKTVEVSQVLVDEPGLMSKLQPVGRSAAVHDPCHLKVGLGVSQEPREVLKAVGVDMVDMEGADECCGGGGLFSLNEPDLSQKIFAPRQQAFSESGAEVLATSCSGCFIQWRRGLDKSIKVVHPLELVGL
jgi:glycolate oxidase iron-sulfur subunit